MSNLLIKFKVFLFLYRWTILFAIFLFYSKFGKGMLFALFILILLNTVYTKSLFSKKSEKYWLLLATIDLIINIMLIGITEQWENPLVYYSLSILLWFGIYIKKEHIYYFSALIFILMIGGVFLLQGKLFLKEASDYLNLLLLVTTSVFIFIVIRFIFEKAIDSYKRWEDINRFINKIRECNSIGELSASLETTIKKVFSVNDVQICWFGNTDINTDPHINYYTRILEELGFHKNISKNEITIPNHWGETKRYFIFSIHNKNSNSNVCIILMPLSELSSLQRYNYIYFKIISSCVLNQFYHIQLSIETASAMKREVRQKLAQDMHDGLAQQLFFLSAQLFQIKNQTLTDNSLKLQIESLESQLKQCHLEVRNYISYLRDEHKLHNMVDALHKLIEQFNRKHHGIVIQLKTRGKISEEAAEVEEVIYRIIEESLNNILKHSQASKVDILIDVTQIQWTIKVKDNGIGFEETRIKELPKNKFGLLGLKERVEQVGGRVTFRSKTGNGTEVMAIIPRGRLVTYV